MILSIIKFFVRFGYKQSINLLRLALGKPLTTPSLGSMTLDKDDVQIAKKWLKRQEDWYRDDEVKQYNNAFARWNGSKCAFAFMGGRVALSACIYALNLQPGDEVILPGYTCVVVPNAFSYAGVKTVYSDIELDTYGLDVSQIENKITNKTKAILIQHLYGLVCRDYESILNLATHHGLKVIEDCAHSTGAEYKGRKVGNLGDVAFYSSEQSKIFNTIQGGMAVTNNDLLAQKLKAFYERAPYPETDWINKLLHNVLINYYCFKTPQRWWKADLCRLKYSDKVLISTTKEEEEGIKPKYYGCKMPAAIAAVGSNQLKKIDYYNERRRFTSKRWENWCEENGYKKPLVIDGSLPIFLRYPVIVETEKKQDTFWAIQKLNVNLGVWFKSNIHPVQKSINGCPNANKAVKQCINFPTII